MLLAHREWTCSYWNYWLLEEIYGNTKSEIMHKHLSRSRQWLFPHLKKQLIETKANNPRGLTPTKSVKTNVSCALVHQLQLDNNI